MHLIDLLETSVRFGTYFGLFATDMINSFLCVRKLYLKKSLCIVKKLSCNS